jgi:hypothetical protein
MQPAATDGRRINQRRELRRDEGWQRRAVQPARAVWLFF